MLRISNVRIILIIDSNFKYQASQGPDFNHIYIANLAIFSYNKDMRMTHYPVKFTLANYFKVARRINEKWNCNDFNSPTINRSLYF